MCFSDCTYESDPCMFNSVSSVSIFMCLYLFSLPVGC